MLAAHSREGRALDSGFLIRYDAAYAVSKIYFRHLFLQFYSKKVNLVYYKPRSLIVCKAARERDARPGVGPAKLHSKPHGGGAPATILHLQALSCKLTRLGAL